MVFVGDKACSYWVSMQPVVKLTADIVYSDRLSDRRATNTHPSCVLKFRRSSNQ